MVHSENIISTPQQGTVRCQSSTCELKDGGLLTVCEPSVYRPNLLKTFGCFRLPRGSSRRTQTTQYCRCPVFL